MFTTVVISINFHSFQFPSGKAIKNSTCGTNTASCGKRPSIQKKEKLPSISEIFLALETERDFFPGKPLQLN